MSLRARILALFLGLGVVPILLLGIIGYARSMRAVRGLLEAQTSEVAHQVASELTARHDLRLSELLLLVENAETQSLYRARAGGSPAVVDSVRQQVEIFLSDAWRRFGGSYRKIEFLDREGRSVYSLGTPVATPHTGVSAETPDLTHTAHLMVPVQDLETGEGTGLLEADVRLQAILPVDALEARFGHAGYTVVVDRREAEVLHHPSRSLVNQPLASLVGSGAWDIGFELFARDSGSFTFSESDSTRIASFVSLQEPPWTVVSTAAVEEFAQPFRGTRRGDLLIVLALAALAGVAFLITTRRATASLQSLTEASERVGRGDLDPPLPPPGPDEVGRLSSAFRLMVGQVREMLHRVEETRQMAVMGELASHVSHQIRNPLTSIKLNLQGLEEEAEAGGMSGTSARSLRICLREVAHLEEAVRRILDLARTHPPKRVETSVHHVISDSVELLQSQLDAGSVRIETMLHAGEDRVLADPEELKNVFVNLLVNAQEAMPEGGVVHITTENPLEAESGKNPEVGSEKTIRIRVRDEGPGVQEDIQEQIFRPFVTTKPEGTGFGLAVARLTVQEHHGEIRLDSGGDPGSGEVSGWDQSGGSTRSRGATFVVELPLAGPPMESGRRAHHQPLLLNAELRPAPSSTRSSGEGKEAP